MLYVLGYELNEKEVKELFILLQNNPNAVMQLAIISICFTLHLLWNKPVIPENLAYCLYQVSRETQEEFKRVDSWAIMQHWKI